MGVDSWGPGNHGCGLVGPREGTMDVLTRGPMEGTMGVDLWGPGNHGCPDLHARKVALRCARKYLDVPRHFRGRYSRGAGQQRCGLRPAVLIGTCVGYQICAAAAAVAAESDRTAVEQCSSCVQCIVYSAQLDGWRVELARSRWSPVLR